MRKWMSFCCLGPPLLLGRCCAACRGGFGDRHDLRSPQGPAVNRRQTNRQRGRRRQLGGVGFKHRTPSDPGHKRLARPVKRRGDWKLTAADIPAGKTGVESAKARWLRKDGLELRWTAQKASGEDVWEFQSELQNTGAAPIPKVKVLGPLSVRLAADPADLAVHYVTRQDYRKHSVAIPAQGLEISGGGWNSPSAAGWIAIENSKAHDVLFLGVEWESYWTVRLTPQAGGGGGVLLQCVLNTQDHDLAPGERLASPRVFLGRQPRRPGRFAAHAARSPPPYHDPAAGQLPLDRV